MTSSSSAVSTIFWMLLVLVLLCSQVYRFCCCSSCQWRWVAWYHSVMCDGITTKRGLVYTRIKVWSDMMVRLFVVDHYHPLGTSKSSVHDSWKWPLVKKRLTHPIHPLDWTNNTSDMAFSFCSEPRPVAWARDLLPCWFTSCMYDMIDSFGESFAGRHKWFAYL